MARPHIVIVGAGFGGLSAAHALAGAEPTSPSSTGATTISSSRCSTRWRRPACRRRRSPRRSAPSCARPPTSASCWARSRRRQGAPHRHARGPHARLRLSGAGDRRAARLFRPRRLGERGARPEEDRRRHRHPPPHPDRLRAMPRPPTRHDERRRFLTFVVIGGGPTGVEMAGAIAELARVALRHDFRNIDPARGAHRAGRGGAARAAGLSRRC